MTRFDVCGDDDRIARVDKGDLGDGELAQRLV
jgi:hypothetical protein